MREIVNKCIIEPIDFLKYTAGVALVEMKAVDSALLCFDPENFRNLQAITPGRAIKGLSAEVWLTKSNIVICGLMGIGSPAAVNLLEEIIACGIKRVVSFGTAGALQDHIIPGDLLICTEAFVDEGTSKHYCPGAMSGKPNEGLFEKMEKFLKKGNHEFVSGKSWTTDAPYRETLEKLNHFLKLGADVVEMEASALYNIATFRNIELLAVLVIGDSIVDGIWEPYFDSKMIKDRLVEVSQIVMEFLS